MKYDTTFSSTSAPDLSSLYLRFPPLSTTKIHGLVFKDTVDIAGVVATSLKLGAVASAKGLLYDTDGILGLGPSKLSLIGGEILCGHCF